MFDLDQFVADCRVALAADKSHKHVRDVVARAVADPASVLKALGEPERAGRWWWEQDDKKECGLHRNAATPASRLEKV